MRAVEVTEAGGPEVLRVVDQPDPVAGAGTLLVRVRAATINPTDLAARAGHTRADVRPPYVLGWDFAGEVVEVGAGVAEFQVGDRVAGMVPWYTSGGRVGAYATHVAVRAEWAALVPGNLDLVRAATVPLNGLTATQGLDLLDVPDGGDLLVTGVSGAVGAFAAQLASQGGLGVTAMCSPGDERWAQATGAAHVLPGRDKAPTNGRFTRVFDAVPLGLSLAPAVADGGRVVSTRPVPPVEGRQVEQSVVLVRPDQKTLRDLLAKAADGGLATRVAEELPLADAARAHALAEAGGLRGKVVLRP